MPNLTLRLTDGEHALLSDSAKANRRSLQREIIYRLFDNEAVDTVVESLELVDGTGKVVGRTDVQPDPKIK